MKIPKFIIFLVLILLAYSCKNKPTSQSSIQYYENTGSIFHTTYHIKYAYSRPLTKEIEDALNQFDNSLNPFKAGTTITKVNNNEAVELDSLFITVFNKSEEVSKISNGLFDITCSPYINAWGFGFKNKENVTPQLLDSLKQFVGYQKIKIENGKIIKSDPRIQLNTSAIAKGYSVDIVSRVLEKFGVKNYMCEIGGEIMTKGISPEKDLWKIGIDKPIDDSLALHHEFQIILTVSNKAIATSGNYRNFYIKDGKKYAHEIDPKTGYPAENNILGATVIAPDCMTADAYATTFMLVSMEDTKRIAKAQGLSYFLIYRAEDGSLKTVQSDDFKNYIK